MASLAALLSQVREEAGDLTPVAVVDAARPEDAPLHPYFEWDNDVAGEKYRLIQARSLIRSVKIAPGPPMPGGLRAYVSVQRADAPPQRVYEPTEEVMADPFLRRMALADMEREWRTLRQRWEHMTEFADMIRRDLPPGQQAV